MSLNIPSIQNGNNQIKFKPNTNVSPTMQGVNIPSIENDQYQSTSMQGNTTMQGAAQESQISNRVKNSAEMGESPYTLPVTLGVWYGIAQGMDKYGEKCAGSYDESLLGKVTGKADQLSDKITNSKLFKSSFGQWVGNKYTSFKKYLDKVSQNPNNRIMYSLRYHKTNPENKFVKMPAAGLKGFLEADTKQVFEEFLKPTKDAQQLKYFGVADDVIEQIGKLPKDAKLAKIQELQLQYFGVNPSSLAGKTADEVADFLKELKVTKGLGFKSLKDFEKLTDEETILSNLHEIKDALRNGDKNLKITIWKKDGKFGKVISHLFGREIGVEELANKFDLALGTGAKTKLGKNVGKAFGWLTEGCTNRFGGGKLAVLMQAGIFADMLIHAFHAPKGEKGKTFMERFVNDFSYFVAMTAGIVAMHKAGGLKYLGMTKEQVKAYRENLKIFNENHKSYGKQMYKMRKKVLDRQLMAGVKNPFLKLVKKAANLLTIGLERVKPYVSKDKANLNILRKSKYFGKNALGYIIRFSIPMMMITPLIVKWATKGENAIFGKPTNSVLDEDKEPEEAEKKSQPVVNNQTQTATSVPEINKTPKAVRNPNSYASDTNLIKMTANGQKYTSPSANTKTTESKTDKNKELEPVRTYIPSPVGMVPKQQTPDQNGIDSVLAEADNAERYVNEVLAMK